MKLIFRNKHDGRFLTPIEVLPNYVRMYHEPSDRVFWYKKSGLHKHLQVVHHDVRAGDVLRDSNEGKLFVAQRVSNVSVILQSRNTQRVVPPEGLINFTRVGRNYLLKQFKRRGITEHPTRLRMWWLWYRGMIGGRMFEAVRSEGWEWKGVGKWSIFD